VGGCVFLFFGSVGGGFVGWGCVESSPVVVFLVWGTGRGGLSGVLGGGVFIFGIFGLGGFFGGLGFWGVFLGFFFLALGLGLGFLRVGGGGVFEGWGVFSFFFFFFGGGVVFLFGVWGECAFFFFLGVGGFFHKPPHSPPNWFGGGCVVLFVWGGGFGEGGGSFFFWVFFFFCSGVFVFRGRPVPSRPPPAGNVHLWRLRRCVPFSLLVFLTSRSLP